MKDCGHELHEKGRSDNCPTYGGIGLTIIIRLDGGMGQELLKRLAQPDLFAPLKTRRLDRSGFEVE
jgi:hypothetical protein